MVTRRDDGVHSGLRQATVTYPTPPQPASGAERERPRRAQLELKNGMSVYTPSLACYIVLATPVWWVLVVRSSLARGNEERGAGAGQPSEQILRGYAELTK